MARPLPVVLVALVAALSVAAPSAQGASGGGVVVTKAGTDEPCPEIDASDPEDVRGGCRASVAGKGTIAIVVRSMVGDMEFGRCSFGHELRVDGTGGTYLTDLTIEGVNPCNDQGPCFRKAERPLKGQIEAGPDGRLTNVVEACLDTCMGQFAGELRLGMERVEGRWVATADRALIGDSGYQLDGMWDLGKARFDVEPKGGSADGDAVAGIWRLTGEPVGWSV